MTRACRMPWIETVAMHHEGDDCLQWPFSTRGGRRPQDAYPALCDGYAHVWLCEKMRGLRPTAQHEVEHLCGDHLCMNWRHLTWATHKENCARRTTHGTQTIGERHGMAILTEAEVLLIRSSRARGVDLAAQFGVSKAQISNVRLGKAWKHLGAAL